MRAKAEGPRFVFPHQAAVDGPRHAPRKAGDSRGFSSDEIQVDSWPEMKAFMRKAAKDPDFGEIMIRFMAEQSNLDKEFSKN